MLCVSRYTRARVLSWAAIAPERVIVLPNTVGEAFTPGDGLGLRKKWGLEGKRVLLTVGRMDARERYKGHDRVIEALPQLVAAGHDVIYVVVGDGDDVGRLKATARRSRRCGPCALHGRGWCSRLWCSAYRMADLFVMPSTGEGFRNCLHRGDGLRHARPGPLRLRRAGCLWQRRIGRGHLGSRASCRNHAILLEQPKPDPHALALRRFAPGSAGRHLLPTSASVIRRLLREPSSATFRGRSMTLSMTQKGEFGRER